jgi:hypothetical protein
MNHNSHRPRSQHLCSFWLDGRVFRIVASALDGPAMVKTTTRCNVNVDARWSGHDGRCVRREHDPDDPDDSDDDADEAPETPLDEPAPMPVQDPPADPDKGPYTMKP